MSPSPDRSKSSQSRSAAAVGAAERVAIGHAYERALLAGRMDEVAALLTDAASYWVAGQPPIGGTWRGRDAVLRAFTNREFGLGAADWGFEELSRTWAAAGDDRVIVEIHERSWLKSDPSDVVDQRTCSVLRFEGDRIAELRDYTDSHVYEEFVVRHRSELPKFRSTPSR
jgi:hypothetical protein